ncbi:hypothetical protein [Promicromonospora sp. MEB111]|uniref:hypothetical protein n=1 Tax=Promicromonospora sp. MEB111 TaxID=3040301 RepID=UPI00254B5460|nr:hypothetical protein [Promicromonospora sp. MEB111]
MNPLRATAVASRALALLTGGALLAGLITAPAIPGAAATAEPSPSATEPSPVASEPAPSLSTTVNGEACGDEPVWHYGDGTYLVVRFTSTFDAPTTATSVLYTVVRPDDTDLDRFPAPVDDGVATGRDRILRLVNDTVYTLETRLRGADGAWAEEPVASCVFGVRQPPVITRAVPVLGADAVYVPGEARGGVGVAGQYLIAATLQGGAVAYEYALTATSSGPTTWETVTVPDTGPTTVPVVPTTSGSQYLHLRGVDRYGVPGPILRKNILVGTAGTSKPVPPAVVVSAEESVDGRVPLRVTLTNDLATWPMGEVVLRHGAQEVGRATFDAQSEIVLVEQSLLGTGFQEVTADYRQFAGALRSVTTARICAKDCAFTGGKVAITALGDVRLDPNLLAEVSGFSPRPTSYTYEWLRAGKVISSGGSDEDAHYRSLPPDEGHTLTARVTAHGPRMTDKTVTVSVKIGDRPDADVCAGGKRIGATWLGDYRYCTTSGDGLVGDPGSGRALEMLVAEPWPGPGYVYSTFGETDDPNVAYWFDQEGYVQGRGWEGLKKKDDVYYVGSVGQNRRLEAFRINDGGPLAPYYDVWYRAYVPKYGWLGWAKNGENSGTTGFDYRLEAVQVRVLPKGKAPATSGTGNAPFYDKATQNQVTVQPYLRPAGWKTTVHGGSTAGLTSTSQRLNAVRVDVNGQRYSGGVQVSAKVEGDGWRSWVGDTKVAGTYHRTDRTSAYKMRLTGEMAKQYDIYYRVHVAGTGWLGWAKNGAGAGTESYKYRNTAVQVVLVKKGERPLMSAYGRAAYKR